jgi:hypothetical protein
MIRLTVSFCWGKISRMSESLENTTRSGASSPGEVQELFEQLIGLAGPEEREAWKRAGTDPVDQEKLVAAIRQIADVLIVQGEVGAAVQFVHKKHVFNLRPLAWPTVILIVEKAVVAIAPGLDSALLPFIDLAAYAEKAREVFRRLDDDEVDVFGVVCDLNRNSSVAPSVVNPDAHPTVAGVTAYLISKKFELTETITSNYIENLLESLVKKGALLRVGGKMGVILFEPTFLGKKGD